MLCLANVSFRDIHVDRGISPRYENTTTNAFLLTYLIVFGIWELWMYRKYGTRKAFNNLTQSKFYLLQLLVAYILSLLAIIRFFAQLHHVYNGQDYGFMVR